MRYAPHMPVWRIAKTKSTVSTFKCSEEDFFIKKMRQLLCEKPNLFNALCTSWEISIKRCNGCALWTNEEKGKHFQIFRKNAFKQATHCFSSRISYSLVEAWKNIHTNNGSCTAQRILKILENNKHSWCCTVFAHS